MAIGLNKTYDTLLDTLATSVCEVVDEVRVYMSDLINGL